MLVSALAQVMPGIRSVSKMNVRSDDRIVIITSADQYSIISEALSVAVQDAGASEVTTLVVHQHDSLGELPEAVEGALRAADLSFCVTKTSISYTDTLIEARRNGLRNISMNLSPLQLSQGGALADYDQIRSITKELSNLVGQSKVAHIHASNGTDISFELGRTPWPLYGVPLEITGWEAAFPDGESMVAPQEGTAEGRYIVDTTILCLGDAGLTPIGLLNEPVTLDISRGEVINISGGAEASQLEAILNVASEGGRMIGEFGIGTNPKAQLVGGHEDKKLLGTVHLALGDNHVFGGTVDCDIHIDMVLNQPTVTLDDRVIMRDGNLEI